MKKLFVISMCLLAMVSCKNGSTDEASRERDSLMQIINQRDEELNDMIGCINEVQEGFQRINEAEGRITIANGNLESGSARDEIRENMAYIQDAMQQNKDMIAQLEQKLKTSKANVSELKKTIANLQKQMEEQSRRIQELEAALAEKDITIAQQGEKIDNLNKNVSDLNQNVSDLTDANNQKAQTVAQQDKELNKAWFVFGTKGELKEQKILKSGDVLKSGDFNKNYFTEIDIRTMKEIKLYSKKAELLTSHPAGTYALEKDSKGEYTLKITNPTRFWSVSKYLVILVK